jgi:acyl CoA:acetate/3-ketoacid CoA transferase alpha subunit
MLTAEDAAELVCDGETLAFGGFTAAGTPTAVSKALAGKALREHRHHRRPGGERSRHVGRATALLERGLHPGGRTSLSGS